MDGIQFDSKLYAGFDRKFVFGLRRPCASVIKQKWETFMLGNFTGNVIIIYFGYSIMLEMMHGIRYAHQASGWMSFYQFFNVSHGQRMLSHSAKRKLNVALKIPIRNCFQNSKCSHIVSAFPFIRWKNNLLKASETWIFLISCIRSAAVDHSIQFENRFPFLLLQNIKEILFFLFLSLSGRNACSINFNSSYILFSSTGFTDHSKWANQLSG